MSLRRLFSTHHRSGMDDTASQTSHAPTYRSFPESIHGPPSYSAIHTDFVSNQPQPSSRRRDSGIPANQPGSPATPPSEIYSDTVQSPDQEWSQGAPSFVSGNSGDEHWQNRADMSSFHGISTPGPSHRPVYYRVYSADGLIPTKQPVSRDDSSLGRTYAHFVPPPHTAATLKRHLVVREGIGRDIPSSLFHDISATVPLEETAAVALLSESGPGSTSHDPLVLVLNDSDASNTMITDTIPQQADRDAAGPSTVNGRVAGPVSPVASATSVQPRPKGWIRVLANDSCKKLSLAYGSIRFMDSLRICIMRSQDKRPRKGFISYQRGEVLYASTTQEVNSYGVIERSATDLSLQRHGKIVMSEYTSMPPC
ncbi:hypothetical protein BS47DRAFT_1481406 [Hydnum rufescens UP504]|uniref:Uncharacterized protein n=1 Tax=Hydnum rufescens UP504 TaxID=1448309 RepID=A0A9P6BC68_9AGAM|nr:hypothetical protein BS47DRAFT_1481406 [Hydnum rufescens UP504]